MKIAILSTIENYSWAGTEEVWAQFAHKALDDGHQVAVSAHWRIANSPQVARLKEKELKVYTRFPFRPLRFYLLKERWFSDMKGLQHFKPDILLINSGSLFDVLNVPALKRFCEQTYVPKIFFCHFCAETLVPANREQITNFLNLIDAWVFVSEHNRKLAERQLAHCFKHSKVILNGPRIHMTENDITWLQSDVVHFACVARFETLWKGHDVLLDVLSQEQWKSRQWHLNLYGEGPDCSYIKALINQYQLDDRVTLCGYVQDIKSVWANNHLMVLASRGEGTPLAVLEAMMCGRPTVTTDVGGNREILEDGVTGFIADAATPRSFGHALEQAWQTRDQWKAMGYQAHLKAIGLAITDPAQQLLNFIGGNWT